jgi:DNA-binding MarR family transcriptional regulator
MDNRRLCLELTDAGRKLVAHAHRYQRTVFEYATRDWTEAAQQEFARLLIKFVASVANTHTQLIESDGLSIK